MTLAFRKPPAGRTLGVGRPGANALFQAPPSQARAARPHHPGGAAQPDPGAGALRRSPAWRRMPRRGLLSVRPTCRP